MSRALSANAREVVEVDFSVTAAEPQTRMSLLPASGPTVTIVGVDTLPIHTCEARVTISFEANPHSEPVRRDPRGNPIDAPTPLETALWRTDPRVEAIVDKRCEGRGDRYPDTARRAWYVEHALREEVQRRAEDMALCLSGDDE